MTRTMVASFSVVCSLVLSPGETVGQVVEIEFSHEGAPDIRVLSLDDSQAFDPLVGVLGAIRVTPRQTLLVHDIMDPVWLAEFARDGTEVRSIGRSGEGPGEYRMVGTATALNDGSILITDTHQSRWTVFDAAGIVVESGRITAGGEPTASDESGWILRESTPLNSTAPSGRVILRTQYSILHPITGESRVIEDWIETEVYYSTDGGMVVRLDPAWAAESYSSIAEGRVAVTIPTRNEVSVFDSEGNAVLRIRLSDPTPALEGEEWEEWVEWKLKDVLPQFQAVTRDRLRSMPRPESKLMVGRVLLDSEKRLWVERYIPEGMASATWDVFSEDGTRLDSIRLPLSVVLHDVAFGIVAGRVKDQWGVERVVTWPSPF